MERKQLTFHVTTSACVPVGRGIMKETRIYSCLYLLKNNVIWLSRSFGIKRLQCSKRCGATGILVHKSFTFVDGSLALLAGCFIPKIEILL